MNNFNYLFAGYSVIWVVLFVYLVVLHKRMRNLQAELDAMSNRKS